MDSIPTGPKYVEYVNGEGRLYYWNADSNSTQWEKPISGQIARVVPSDNFSKPHSISLTQNLSGTNLFIFHLPNEWSEEDLSRNFAAFGTIISARIMTDRETGRSRGFGFVSYDNTQSAHAAVRSMNGFSVLGKRLKVQLKKENPIPR